MSEISRGVVAVIRTDNSEWAYNLAKAFDSTSVIAIEITMTVPKALDVIHRLIDEGVQRVGGGTVRTLEQVESLAKMKASFAVSPHSDERIIKRCVELNLPVTPGTLTPSEMVRAMQWGATSAKVFPINSVGGLSYVKYVLEPLPDIPLVVSGGVTPEEVQKYLDLGCVGVCMGGALWDEKITASGNIALMNEYANNALARM
jgi:2-dehydro-3-deoxyphosphogluconate aldolase/(4S)-4-hydroxy-2-oxoglutarate aldolase